MSWTRYPQAPEQLCEGAVSPHYHICIVWYESYPVRTLLRAIGKVHWSVGRADCGIAHASAPLRKYPSFPLFHSGSLADYFDTT